VRIRFVFILAPLFVSVASSSARIDLDLVPIVDRLQYPIYVTHAGDGSGRLFVVEREGRIRILDREGNLLEKDFIDLGPEGLNRVLSSAEPRDEQGLLGLAFHPQYEENGRFFVHYSLNTEDKELNGATIVAEYHVTEDPNVAAPDEKIIFGPIPQPYSNHNGGSIEFNPKDDCEGCLYLTLGDGGAANDPLESGQNINTYLGKILRFDVDAGDPYGIPPDNPFVGQDGLDEIFAYGLRNVWRFSFDRETGRLFAGDVGQATREEVDIVEKGGNYGWNTMEGFSCFDPPENCDTAGLELPIAQYEHPTGCSITGGYVYRGSRFPELYGLYFYADFCVGRIWTIEEKKDGSGWKDPIEQMNTGKLISSFGEDEEGELYVVECLFTDGKILHVVNRPEVSSPRISISRGCCLSVLNRIFGSIGLE